MIYGCQISLAPLPQSKLKITPTSAMLHFKGNFNTNYLSKFQIYAMIFSISNLIVSKLCFGKMAEYSSVRYTRLVDKIQLLAFAKARKV